MSVQKRLVHKSNWFLHPNYIETVNNTISQDKRYDMALIKIEESFNQTTEYGFYYAVNTVCLPSKERNNQEYENATGFGYGFIDHDKLPDSLRKGVFAIKPKWLTKRYMIFAAHNETRGEVYYPSTSCPVGICTIELILIKYNVLINIKI